MRYSISLIPTLREDPADAEVVSHKLMLRGGYIRKVAAGIYSYLPLGLRVFKKVERIVREEMDAAGAQELLMPMIQPCELWQESGRWDFYGKELLRFKDRAQHDYCAGPTHEEVITDIARREIKSYRDLPKNLYQIQTKFRDEIRPRFGLMRGREFIMKDAYSFDVNEKAAFESYEVMYQTYKNIFSRMGLTFRPVEAATGAIGGTRSHEFHVLADSGEDAIFFCNKCEYASNVERTRTISDKELERLNAELKSKKPAKKYQEVATPGKKTIDEVSAFLKVKPSELVKTLIYYVESREKPFPVAVMLKGNTEVVEAKLIQALSHTGLIKEPDAILILASEDNVKSITGADVGFAGPIGLKGDIKVLADASVFGDGQFVVGANKTDAHLRGVEWSDCGIHAFVDVRRAADNDKCPACGGVLQEKRGIEVGQVFYLGTKYSSKMRAVYLDENGKEQFMVMGCYGIGITRTAAAAIEQNHDDKGIIWPLAIAPFHVEIISAGEDEKVKAMADSVYVELQAAGLEVLYDDRPERPGVKFADADLIGIPYHVIVGKKAIEAGKLEMKVRRTGERTMVEVREIVELINKELK